MLRFTRYAKCLNFYFKRKVMMTHMEGEGSYYVITMTTVMKKKKENKRMMTINKNIMNH